MLREQNCAPWTLTLSRILQAHVGDNQSSGFFEQRCNRWLCPDPPVPILALLKLVCAEGESWVSQHASLASLPGLVAELGQDNGTDFFLT